MGGIIYESLKRTLAVVERGITFAALVSGIGFLVISFVITWAVFARKYGGWVPPAIDDLGGFTVAVGSTWVMAWGLKAKGHIRIDVVFRLFPVVWRGALNVVALTLLTAFAVFISWRSWAVVMVSAERGATVANVLNTPLVWPQSGWAFGFSIFAFYAVLLWLVSMMELLQGKVRELAISLGPDTEEVDEIIALAREDATAVDGMRPAARGESHRD